VDRTAVAQETSRRTAVGTYLRQRDEEDELVEARHLATVVRRSSRPFDASRPPGDLWEEHPRCRWIRPYGRIRTSVSSRLTPPWWARGVMPFPHPHSRM